MLSKQVRRSLDKLLISETKPDDNFPKKPVQVVSKSLHSVSSIYDNIIPLGDFNTEMPKKYHQTTNML